MSATKRKSTAHMPSMDVLNAFLADAPASAKKISNHFGLDANLARVWLSRKVERNELLRHSSGKHGCYLYRPAHQSDGLSALYAPKLPTRYTARIVAEWA